jgi:hypothetical protein
MERTPLRSEAAVRQDAVTTSRGGRFRYRLVDLAGADVGRIEREQPLRAGDVLAAWRVVGVLGACATVAHAPASAP